ETVAPPARAHGRSLTREISRQLVVKGQDHRLFAREIPIEQPDADVRLPGDVSKGRRLVPALGDQAHGRGIQAVSRRGALSRLPRRATPLSGLDILSEHAH